MNAANRQKWRDALPVVQRIADALGDEEVGASGLCNACRYADWSYNDEPRCEHPIVVTRGDLDLADAVWSAGDCCWFRPRENTPRIWADDMLVTLAERACNRADDSTEDGNGLSAESWNDLDARLTAQGETIIREAGL